MFSRHLTVDHLLRSSADARPQQTAIIDADEVITYQQFDQRVTALASFLHSRGIGAGQPVAYLFNNQWEMLITYHAILRVGGVVVSLNYRLSAAEVHYQLQASAAVALIFDAGFSDLANQALNDINPRPITLVARGDQGASDSFEQALRGSSSLPEFKVPVDDDNSGIWFTSGTTGQPKGAVVTHRSSVAGAIATSQVCGMTAGCKVLACAPMFHRGAMEDIHLAVTMVGGTHYLLPRFDAKKTLETIQDHAISHAFIVPTMSWMILQLPDADQYDLSSMRCWMSASAPLAPELIDQLQQRLQLTEGVIANAYGITESLMNTFCSGADLHRERGSVGQAVPGMLVRVHDGERFVEAGEHGELVTCGPSTLRSYLNDPAATAEASFVADGLSWYRTGDLGYKNAAGFIYLVDRKKDMIISGGENVYSVEVEQTISRHPGVTEVAVVGLPDEKWGEAVTACVVFAAGDHSEAEILVQCATLATYKRPRSVVLMEALPRNSFGKIQKGRLRELLAEKSVDPT